MSRLTRIVGLFLLVAGWFLLLAAVTLLDGRAALPVFVLASFSVQALGLIIVFHRRRRA